MKTFTDAAGRNWTLTLNLATAMAVKDRLGADLLAPEAPYRDPSSSEASAKEEPLLTRLVFLLLALMCMALCGTGCTRTIYVPHGTPVRLRETVEDV